MIMKYITLTIISLILFSCKDNSSEKGLSESNSPRIEMNEVEDNFENISNQQNEIKKEVVANRQKIIKKFGKQLDFCSCIQFHDSLNNAAQKELSDQQIEKLLNRWEQMEVKCKELVNTEHRTPEERLAHERRVQNCLK